MATPPLGWIEPAFRTREQQDSHERAVKAMPKFTMQAPNVPKGTKVILTSTWRHPDVIADIGMEFTGFHQLTGSCVGASAGNCVATLAFIQRLLTEGATRAFIPFWPFFYGRTRFNEGDRGEGEGAVDSVMGETLSKEGCFDIKQSGLPSFSTDDGLYLTERLEYTWSYGGNSSVFSQWMPVAAPHTMQRATINDVQGIKAALLSGRPVLDGCAMYVGNGSIKGSGDNALVVGQYDGRGGHSTCYLGYYEHPDYGPHYLYSNQWPTSTYPRDPAGGGRCCVWQPESDVQRLFRLGGDGGETMCLYGLNWPAVPIDKLIDWTQL